MEANLFFRHARSKRTGLIKAATILILLSLIAQPVFAHNANPNVVPPNSKPYGKSYAEWNAEWWRYVISFPANTSPLNDTTGKNCAVGQSGPVFFLVGTAGGSATRNECEVPAGKALFFPIANFFCAEPEDGFAPGSVRKLCTWATDTYDVLEASVGGVPLENLWDYRFPSQYFAFDGAIDNPYDTYCTGVESGLCYEGYHKKGFSDGYWIMLDPLPAGEHTIKFYGHSSLDFEVDITYNLLVEE